VEIDRRRQPTKNWKRNGRSEAREALDATSPCCETQEGCPTARSSRTYKAAQTIVEAKQNNVATEVKENCV
jgi:hypothetical protein